MNVVTRTPHCTRGRAAPGKVLAACAGLAIVVPIARPANAQSRPPPSSLRSRSTRTFEQIERRGSFTVSQHVEELDGDGKVSSVKNELSHIESDGKASHETVLKSEEDGKDTTQKEQAEAPQARRERRQEEEGRQGRRRASNT